MFYVTILFFMIPTTRVFEECVTITYDTNVRLW